MNPADIVPFLKRNPPFSQMPEADLDWLAARLAPADHAAGAIVLAPGASPGHLVFVTGGKIDVEAVGEAVPDDRRLIAEIVAGECFPVEALQEIRPVFSTYRAADEGVRTLLLSAADFAGLKARSPIFAQYCDDRANAFLGSSRRIFEAHFGRRMDNAVTLEAPLSTLRLRRPDTCPAGTPVIKAIETLSRSGESAIVIVDDKEAPLGVFTLHDLVSRVLLAGGDTNQPVGGVMTAEVVSLPLEANGYEAAQAMADHGVNQILVVDEGRLQGAVSEGDLFAAQHLAMGQLSARIRNAQHIDSLALLAQEIRTLAKRLMDQGIAAEPLTRIISSLIDRLTDKVITLAQAEEATPLPAFCWIALGSEGRHEQTLSTDQDNGIIFADDGPPEEARQRLLPFARRVNEALAACGFPLCKGNIMASNPLWCLSLSEWKQRFSAWIGRPGPEEILNATIFFDFRPLYGNHLLAQSLGDWLLDALQEQPRFFHNLAAEALTRSPPLGLFRDFVVDQDKSGPGTIDLKLSGVTLFVDAARILALRARCGAHGTTQRLRQAAAALKISASEAESWIDAFHFVQLLRLRHQYAQIEAGEAPTNRLDPYKLNELDRKVFIESLRQAKRLQKRLEVLQGP